MRISEVGETPLQELIPTTMNLYLDKNLLYSWDQYFKIIKQLPYLRTVVLTGNKFKKLDEDYLADKDVAYLTHTCLSELVFIDMALDWQQVLTLAPVICYVEQLHLVRNFCNEITKVPTDHFKVLKFINLEENGLTSWD